MTTYQQVAINLEKYPSVQFSAPLAWEDQDSYLVRPATPSDEVAGYAVSFVRRPPPSLWRRIKIWWTNGKLPLTVQQSPLQFFFMRKIK